MNTKNSKCWCDNNECVVKFDSENDLGMDIYFWDASINKTIDKLITEGRLLNDSWKNYLVLDTFTTWGDLWNYIEINKDKNAVMQHLYNSYKEFNVPKSAKLQVEYCY
jgi:hypothetical protein